MNKATPLFSYSFTGATARSNFGIKWSEDGKIAVVSMKGVYIVEIVADCHVAPIGNFNVEVHFIPAFHVQSFNPYLKGDLYNLDVYRSARDKTSAFEIMLDRTVTPKRVGDDPANNSTVFWSVEWSPPFFGPRDERHALATLSVDYYARIYSLKIGKHWDVICDLSKALYDHYKSVGWEVIYDFSGVNNASTLEKAKACSYRQAFIGIKWLHCVLEENGRKYARLLTLQKDGLMILWRVQLSANEEKADIVEIFDTGIASPVSFDVVEIEDSSALLTVASRSGTISLLTLQFPSECPVAYGLLGFLWEEEDEIEANHLILTPSEKGGSSWTLYAAKSMFLVAVTFSLTDNGIGDVRTGHTSEPVLISGIQPYTDGSVLYVSELFGTKMARMTEAGLKVQSFVLGADSSNFSCRGISKSPHNATLFCTLDNIRVPYDHLTVRDPARISFYVLKNSPYDVFHDLCDSELPLRVKGDLLETFRCLVRQNTLTSVNFFNEEDVVNLNHYRIVRWLAMADYANERKNKVKDEEKMNKFDSIREKCERKILESHCTSALQSLKHLTAEEKLTALLMSDYLTTLTNCSKEAHATYALLGEEVSASTGRERCRFDQENISFTKPSQGGCSQGHNFQRCMQSFRLCYDRPIRFCLWCKAAYRKDAVLDLESTCTFCLLPLRFSNE